MSDATRRLSVRLSVDGAQQMRQELTRTGEAGEQALARIVGGAQRASSALNLLGIGLGALSVGALATFARRAVDAVDGLGELADQLGVWTDALQAFRFAAIETGVRNEELERGLATLTRRIAEAATGERAAEEAFRRLGVAFTDAAGNARTTEGVLADIADRIAAVESPAERARIATEVFGDRLGQR
ncbi:phage tail tape measure protein, partial [Elioraea sp.]|uniref:phage tail tape measure protein n=1 Tax=Elioraea sp. TaxID=2185103 RepID=UPI003F720BDF